MAMRRGPLNELTSADRALLEQLVADTGPRLLAYVRRVYADSHEAEDIVSDTFVRAAQNIAAVRSSARPDLYLLTTARDLCRDRFRKKTPLPVSDERLSREPSDASAPATALEREEALEALRAAVAGLPEAQREIVVLRLSVGLRFEEIAETMQIPLGTALSRMNAAMQKLKKELGYVPQS